MERYFSFSDAKNLLQRYQRVLDQIHETGEVGDIYRNAVQKAANRYIAAEVLKLMRDIPVEEVNREKRGIRVKALRESGYTTYADILTASVYQLSTVLGISEDGARVVKRIVSDASEMAQKTTKLRLSVDNKTLGTTRLVVALSQYHRARQISAESERLIQENFSDVQTAFSDIQTATSIFRWLFASKQKSKKPLMHIGFWKRICAVGMNEKRKDCLTKPES